MKKNIFEKLALNLGSYAQQVAAVIKGDDAAATAAKIEIQGRAALNSGISTLEGELHDARESVSDAQEDLRLALLNSGQEIKGLTARQTFLQKLNEAHTKLVWAERALAKKEEEKAFYEQCLGYINRKDS